MTGNLAEAYAKLRAAQAAYYRTIRYEYPVGGSLHYQRGGAGRVLCGIVLRHDYEDRLKVRNVETGAEYWIVASYIV